MQRVDVFFLRHPWVQIVLAVAAASVVTWLLYPGRSFVAVVARTAVISVGGIAYGLAARRKEKRAAGGSTDRLVSLQQRLRTGEAPSDPEGRRAMHEVVEQRLHRSRHHVAALVFLTVLFVGITVLTALTAGPRQTIGMAVVTVLFLGYMSYTSRVQLRRLRTMRAALASDGAFEGSAVRR